MSKIYEGDRYGHVTVHTDDGAYPLPLYLNVRNHSPTGFAWGYGGSGPSQLALAILMDLLGSKEKALKSYMDLKWNVISKLQMDEPFRLTEEEILKAI